MGTELVIIIAMSALVVGVVVGGLVVAAICAAAGEQDQPELPNWVTDPAIRIPATKLGRPPQDVTIKVGADISEAAKALDELEARISSMRTSMGDLPVWVIMKALEELGSYIREHPEVFPADAAEGWGNREAGWRS